MKCFHDRVQHCHNTCRTPAEALSEPRSMCCLCSGQTLTQHNSWLISSLVVGGRVTVCHNLQISPMFKKTIQERKYSLNATGTYQTMGPPFDFMWRSTQQYLVDTIRSTEASLCLSDEVVDSEWVKKYRNYGAPSGLADYLHFNFDALIWSDPWQQHKPKDAYGK